MIAVTYGISGEKIVTYWIVNSTQLRKTSRRILCYSENLWAVLNNSKQYCVGRLCTYIARCCLIVVLYLIALYESTVKLNLLFKNIS